MNEKEAAKLLKSDRLWVSDYHAISDHPEEVRLIDISSIARKLTFNGGVKRLPLDYSGKNLQTMRLLTPDATKLLNDLWAKRHEQPKVIW